MESQNNITEQMKEAARNAESKAFAGMENVWDRVAARLDADEEPKPAVVPFINYKKIAAAAAVLILMGLGAGYLLFNDKAEHTIANNDIKPTYHTATPEKPVVTASQPDVPKQNITIPEDIKGTPGYSVASKSEANDVEDAVANENHPVVSNEGIPVAEATEVVPETQAVPPLGVNKGIAKGKVTDQNNEGIPGAYIKIAGTTLGTMTDVDGNFEIETHSNNEKLTIGVEGFEEKTLNASSSMAVNLKPSSIAALTEVTVAMPYGPNISKQKYVGAADVMTSKQIERMPVSDITKELEKANYNPSHLGYSTTVTNNSAAYLNSKPVAINDKPSNDITKAIEGAAPGVQVSGGGGQPGTGASLQVRGVGSLSQATQPLIIVDGAPYDGDISSIDPKDIESITILKDTTATSLYGSRSSNGTIIIKSKEKTSDVASKQNEVKASSVVANEKQVNAKHAVDSATGYTVRCVGSMPLSPPCIVLNGAPYNGDISGIDVNSIATVTVLKDAKATSLYGARGANGVIIITTKDYKAKAKKWSFKHLFKKRAVAPQVDTTHH